MPLARQTVALLQAARQLVESLPADAVLLLTETDLDWDAVREHLGDSRLLVAAESEALTEQLKARPDLTVLDIDAGPTPTQELLSLALLEAAILIRRDGVAEAACMRIEAPDKGLNVTKGLGTRHAAAAAISRATKAVAVVVSQSSGSVRLYLNGEMVLHIEPFGPRPLTWAKLRMEGADVGANRPGAAGTPAR